MNACGRGIDRRSGTRDRLLDMAQFVWQLGCPSCEPRRRKPLTASAMYDRGREVYGSRARMRAAGDDQEVRDQLIALARDWIVAARKEDEEEDDDSKVLVFPSAVERSRRHGLTDVPASPKRVIGKWK